MSRKLVSEIAECWPCWCSITIVVIFERKVNKIRSQKICAATSVTMYVRTRCPTLYRSQSTCLHLPSHEFTIEL